MYFMFKYHIKRSSSSLYNLNDNWLEINLKHTFHQIKSRNYAIVKRLDNTRRTLHAFRSRAPFKHMVTRREEANNCDVGKLNSSTEWQNDTAIKTAETAIRKDWSVIKVDNVSIHPPQKYFTSSFTVQNSWWWLVITIQLESTDAHTRWILYEPSIFYLNIGQFM